MLFFFFFFFSNFRCIQNPHKVCATRYRKECTKQQECTPSYRRKCIKIPYEVCVEEPVSKKKKKKKKHQSPCLSCVSCLAKLIQIFFLSLSLSFFVAHTSSAA